MRLKNVTRCLLLGLSVLFLACQQFGKEAPPNKTTEVSGIENSASRSKGLPYNPYTGFDPYQDYINYDLSSRDLRESLDDLLMIRFNSNTKWPPPGFLPDEFDPQEILESGKNPGLGIRELHQSGITGQGIGIALIDQPLNQDHIEYRERLMLYEIINSEIDPKPEMHGAAVASLAVGKNVGTAPQADLYYIAARNGRFNETGEYVYDFHETALAIYRILEINNSLPEDRKIRVISIQSGIRDDFADTSEVNKAIDAARQNNIFVIYSNLEDTYGFGFHGLGRDPLTNPDLTDCYEPAFTQIEDYEGIFDPSLVRLLAPMDSRTFADAYSTDGYLFDRVGGRSWVMPYLAGVYALAAQTYSNITPEKFWDLALDTGYWIMVESGNGLESLGPILNPGEIMRVLQEDQ